LGSSSQQKEDGEMKKEIMDKYIDGLEDIKNKNSITIDNLEMLLSEIKEE